MAAQQQQALPRGGDVPAAVRAMADAVKRGEFWEAERIGSEASFPLAIPKHALRLGVPISEGAQAAVLAATLLPEHAGGAAGGAPRPVAVKRPRIRESADLERFREEVSLLAALQHPGLVGLVGARLLPPGEAGGAGREVGVRQGSAPM